MTRGDRARAVRGMAATRRGNGVMDDEVHVTGDRAGAPALYKEYAGEPLIVCAEFLAETLGADHLVVPGHYPHTQQPGAVNAALREVWARG